MHLLALLHLGRSAGLNVLREIPAFGYLLALIPAGLIARLTPASKRSATFLTISAASGLLVLLAFVVLNFLSLHSFLLSDDEANILSIAAATLHGQPAYPSVHSHNFSYGLLYGPLTFLVPNILFRISHALWAIHASIALANLFLCLLLWITARRYLSRTISLAILAYPLAPFLRIIDHTAGFRPEVGQFFFTSLAALFTLTGPVVIASVLAGVCAGLAMGFKLTVLPAIAFLLLLLFRLRGLRAAVIATGAMVVTVLIPFLLPAYSLRNYLDSFLSARSEPPSNFFAVCLFFSVSLLLPFLVLRCFGIRPWSPAHSRFGAIPELTLLVIGLLASAVIAAKPGGGLWHICQFVPVLTAYLILTLATPSLQRPRFANRLPLALMVVVLGSAIYGLSYVYRDFRELQPPPAGELDQATHEIDDALTSFPDRTLQVGYGSNTNALPSLLRFIPVLRGQPYTLDGSGRIEVIPNPFPPGILDRINQCSDDLWLIPSHESPFDSPVFPGELHDAFLDHYKIVQRNVVYDLWSCKADPPKASAHTSIG